MDSTSYSVCLLFQIQKPSWCFAVTINFSNPASLIASTNVSASKSSSNLKISSGFLSPYFSPHSISLKVFGPKWQNAANSCFWYSYWFAFGTTLSFFGATVWRSANCSFPTNALSPANAVIVSDGKNCPIISAAIKRLTIFFFFITFPFLFSEILISICFLFYH